MTRHYLNTQTRAGEKNTLQGVAAMKAGEERDQREKHVYIPIQHFFVLIGSGLWICYVPQRERVVNILSICDVTPLLYHLLHNL